MNNKYDIVVATDANYVIHTLTLMASVGSNEKETVCFHIFAFFLSEDDKRKFEIIPFNFSQISYKFYDLTDDFLKKELFSGIEVAHDRSLAAYARLLIPEILNDNIHRCVYMDVDAVVQKSLKDYYEFSFDNYSLAGVSDTNPISRHINVGLGKNDIYINSGMIVWNLDACREKKLVDDIRLFIKNCNGQIDAMDQGTLNGALSQHIKELPPRYNVLTSYFQMNSKEISSYYRISTYSDEEIKEARKEPLFVHFTPNLTTRPWMEHCKHPLATEYWKYRRIISSSKVLSKDTRPLKLKILSRLFYFNHSVFFFLLKLIP